MFNLKKGSATLWKIQIRWWEKLSNMAVKHWHKLLGELTRFI